MSRLRTPDPARRFVISSEPACSQTERWGGGLASPGMENDPSPTSGATPPPPLSGGRPPLLASPPPPPSPRRRRSGWRTVAVILGVLLLMSGLGNLQQFVTQKSKGSRFTHQRLEEVTVEQNYSRNKVAI